MYTIGYIVQLPVISCMKKDKHFSFRTTQANWDYILQLAESDDRTPSYILNKMIDAFRKRGAFTPNQLN